MVEDCEMKNSKSVHKNRAMQLRRTGRDNMYPSLTYARKHEELKSLATGSDYDKQKQNGYRTLIPTRIDKHKRKRLKVKTTETGLCVQDLDLNTQDRLGHNAIVYTSCNTCQSMATEGHCIKCDINRCTAMFPAFNMGVENANWLTEATCYLIEHNTSRITGNIKHISVFYDNGIQIPNLIIKLSILKLDINGISELQVSLRRLKKNALTKSTLSNCPVDLFRFTHLQEIFFDDKTTVQIPKEMCAYEYYKVTNFFLFTQTTIQASSLNQYVYLRCCLRKSTTLFKTCPGSFKRFLLVGINADNVNFGTGDNNRKYIKCGTNNRMHTNIELKRNRKQRKMPIGTHTKQFISRLEKKLEKHKRYAKMYTADMIKTERLIINEFDHNEFVKRKTVVKPLQEQSITISQRCIPVGAHEGIQKHQDVHLKSLKERTLDSINPYNLKTSEFSLHDDTECIILVLDIHYLNICLQRCLFLNYMLLQRERTVFLPDYFYSLERCFNLKPSHEIFVYPLLTDYFSRLANGPPLTPGEEFCCEAVRLDSFKNFPQGVPVSTVKLAKSGFCFTGHADEVLCFSCGGRLKHWHYGDEPNVRYRQTFPNCNFINGQDMSNIPLGINSNQTQEGMDVDDPQSDVIAGNTGTSDMIDGGVPLRGEEMRMKVERNRLQTYTGWPASAPVFPDELARNGFYYTGIDDRVQCAFCRGILRDWEPGDRVDSEHRHHFPECGFVRTVDVGNIPLGSEPRADCSGNQPLMLNVTTGEDILSDPANAAMLGIDTGRPKNPFYALFQHRVGSYGTWPITMKQRPEQLADAGFYFTGFSDNVKCFFCDGGLRNWEPGEDPWTEHARWFPRCGFVRREKGETYIRGISEHYTEERNAPVVQEAAGSAVNITRPEAQASTANLPGVDCMVEPRKIKARMDTDKVKTVLGMGYSHDVVRKALDIQFKTKGDEFPSTSSLLEAVVKLVANQNTAESSGSGLPSGACNVPELPKTKKKGESRGENVPVENKKADSKSIEQENEKLKEERTCKICMDAYVNVVFLPCGHLVCCQECAQSLKNCPICRSTIRGTVKTYMS